MPPLAGLRVVEISLYVQGPIAGLTLASLGADIVKIEQVGRTDSMRASLFLDPQKPINQLLRQSGAGQGDPQIMAQL